MKYVESVLLQKNWKKRTKKEGRREGGQLCYILNFVSMEYMKSVIFMWVNKKPIERMKEYFSSSMFYFWDDILFIYCT